METQYAGGCEVGSHKICGGLLTRYSASQPRGAKRAAVTEGEEAEKHDNEAYIECP
jgi:hypothetical protein